MRQGFAAIQCPDIVIPNGTAVSNWVYPERVHGDAVDIILMPQTSFPATTVQVSYKKIVEDGAPTTAGTDIFDLYDDQPTPVIVSAPAAGQAREYIIPYAFRLKAAGNVGADRTCKMMKSVEA